MKKKFLTIFSIVFVMAFAVAVYAFNQSNTTSANTAVSGAMKNNCPLKGKNAQTAGVKSGDSCCDKADCCCKGDSCPMKQSGGNNGDCCGNCCGGSCPMKEKQTTAAAVQTEKETCLHKTAGV
jgi:hypothetical protein